MTDTDVGKVVRVDQSPSSGLDRFFHITERGSTVRTEIMAGVTTWLTMAYILFVNPQILGFIGIPDREPLGLAFPQVLTVTALTAGVMTIADGCGRQVPVRDGGGARPQRVRGVHARRDQRAHLPEAMGVIVVEGILITIFVLTGVRETIMNAIPMDLKRAIGIGIGAFIALIGLVNAGVVTNTGATPLSLGAELTTWPIRCSSSGSRSARRSWRGRSRGRC